MPLFSIHLLNMQLCYRTERASRVDVDMPFELGALEAALHVAVAAVEADTLQLEQNIGASLDRLDLRVPLQPYMSLLPSNRHQFLTEHAPALPATILARVAATCVMQKFQVYSRMRAAGVLLILCCLSLLPSPWCLI